MDIKGEINRNVGIVENFNTPLTSMNRSSRQKINKETAALNGPLDQMDLSDYLQRISLQRSRIYILFKCKWMFSRINHMLGHKTSLNKYKIEIIPSIFPNHNAKKLEINHKKNTEKYTRYESK